MQNYRPFTGITPAVKILLILNIVMYFLSMFIDSRMHVDTAHLLGLHLPQSVFWRPWQYVTHMFMHGSFGHLFFNMFALFMFGRILESVWGTQRFLIFYFVCGIGAGLLNSAVGWLEIHRLMEQYYAFQNAPSPALLAQLVERQLGHPAQWVWEVVDNWTNNPDSKTTLPSDRRTESKCPDDRGFGSDIRYLAGIRNAVSEYGIVSDVYTYSDQSKVFCIGIRSAGAFPGHAE